MSGMNETNLRGRIGEEPEIRATSANDGTGKVAIFSVATNETYTNKQGERVTKTEWHRCVSYMPSFIKRLEGLQKIGPLKGKQVFVRGKNVTRKYTKDGETTPRYITEILLAGPKYEFDVLEKISDANPDAHKAPAPAPEAGEDTPPPEKPEMPNVSFPDKDEAANL